MIFLNCVGWRHSKQFVKSDKIRTGKHSQYVFGELETNFMQLQFHTIVLHIEVLQSTMSSVLTITENENLKFHNLR